MKPLLSRTLASPYRGVDVQATPPIFMIALFQHSGLVRRLGIVRRSFEGGGVLDTKRAVIVEIDGKAELRQELTRYDRRALRG